MHSDPLERVAALERLEATHDLLKRVKLEHKRALEAAIKACSLAEVAAVLDMTRAGVQYHRNRPRKTKKEGGNMTTLIERLRESGLIEHKRERSESMYWLTDHSTRFLSFGRDRVILWQSHRPYSANTELASLPIESATAADVALMVAEATP